MSPPERSDGGALVAEDVVWLRVEDDTGPGTVRRRVVDLAQRMGLNVARTGEVAIVATELSTNLVKHAREGVVVLRTLWRGGVGGVEIVALDHGPGMRDVRGLFGNGTSTTGTLGIGLGAVRRLSSRYDVHSVPGRGTVVTASFWQDAPDTEELTAGLTRTLAGESECGDAYAVRQVPDGFLLLSVDGLGHGPLAARAATAATRIFRDSRQVSPGALMTELHRGLSHTRGAAAAIGHLDLGVGRLTYSGIGNITGRIVTAERMRSLATYPGIVGHNALAVRETVYDVVPGAWVVLHSDGLSEKWDIADYPGVLEHTPLVLAATLIREAANVRDDASVLVAKAGGA
ncbi:ATP-binding SpoIIE family protein phosphatase [Nocardioides mesophilus]|uniref:ATP-binding protein n=1 Tax=Nocardioides mesophilus TaxID=433659 RepID=A0A7G9RCH8_9ACTN|nr:ATP-binding SpoIIE family protein phosphatase [Nocardioides mesophilus]QNN53303.1 ATP-binding protein [Nocardioides mesophilus]